MNVSLRRDRRPRDQPRVLPGGLANPGSSAGEGLGLGAEGPAAPARCPAPARGAVVGGREPVTRAASAVPARGARCSWFRRGSRAALFCS